MAEAHAAPRCRASVPVEIGASSLLQSLTCLDSPLRAGDIPSGPQAGGAGRANGARLDGVARARPARRNRCREPLQIEQKALTKMRAVARNIDFVSVSEKAPASAFAWVAVRVRIICCYASAIPQSICEALAELFSCRPPRVDRWPMPRLVTAEPSCARCRECGWTRDADDNWSALITPSNARFTDLGMLVSRLTFIQQRSYDRRCRTSHSCQNRTHEPHKPGGGEKPGEASCQPALSQLLTFPFATQMEPPSDAPGHEKCHREENEQR